jgi:hypothetical protein
MFREFRISLLFFPTGTQRAHGAKGLLFKLRRISRCQRSADSGQFGNFASTWAG